jgi:ABC-type transport system involved in multi-copper enzyme maturation permease subunit
VVIPYILAGSIIAGIIGCSFVFGRMIARNIFVVFKLGVFLGLAITLISILKWVIG